MNNFAERIRSLDLGPLKAREVATLQVNLGYRCNLACKHCHIAASPERTECMDGATLEAVLQVLAGHPIPVLDITGGSPELHPGFRGAVERARRLGRRVIVRTNLAVFFEEGRTDLPEFFAANDVDVVASLPSFQQDAVDRVRGAGTFTKSVAALQRLNTLGYGGGSDSRRLSLVHNPPGAFLAPDQTAFQEEYKRELKDRFDISFDSLYTFTNMPIGRFRDFLARTGNLDAYLNKLACAFNPRTLDGIMCRRLLSVGWDGTLYDCDFNQVLGLAVNAGDSRSVQNFDFTALESREISVGDHCFGCTAGRGST